MLIRRLAVLLFGPLVLWGCAGSSSSELVPDPLGSPALPRVSTGAARTKEPWASEMHYRSAGAALAGVDADQAQTELRLALQADPLNAESHFLLGSLLAQQGECDHAVVGFQRSVALDPAKADALYNLGTMLLERGEPLPAARLFENAVLARADHIRAYNNLGKAYFLNLNFNYFASDSKNEGTGPPDVTGVVSGLSQSSWICGAQLG